MNALYHYLWRVFILLFIVGLSLLFINSAKDTLCPRVNLFQESKINISNCIIQYENSNNHQKLILWINDQGIRGEVDALRGVEFLIVEPPHHAIALMEAAAYLEVLDELELAIHYYQSSSTIFQKEGMDAELARAQYKLSFLAWQKSDYKEALLRASTALDASHRSGESSTEIAVLTVLFSVFEDIGNLGPAQHALSLINKKLGKEVSGARINTYISQGLLHMNRQEFGLAAHQFELALEAANGSKNRAALRGLHLNIVHAYLKLGRTEKAALQMAIAWEHANPDGSMRFALEYFQSLLYFQQTEFLPAGEAIARALSDPDLPPAWEWELHYWAGKSARKLNHHPRAIASFLAAVHSLESLRKGMDFDELKAQLLSRKRDAYEALFLEYVKNNQWLKALAITETAKAGSFLDAFIHETDAALPTAEDVFPIKPAANRIDSMRDYLSSLRVSQPSAHIDYDTLLSIPEGSALLSYFLAESEFYLLYLNGGKIQIHALGLHEKDLDEYVYLYRATPSDQQLLRKLGDALFPKKLRDPEVKHLYVSPDSLISDIAFSSLRLEDQYLIEQHSLSMVPGVAALHAMVERSREPKAFSKAVFIGDPDGDLPGARREVEAVAKQLSLPAFTGTDAHQAQFLKASSASVLHIATHAGIDYLGPWLHLADGKVYGNRILRDKLQPHLVVLASCASGVGRDRYFWGSLGGVFLSSGANLVLAALWSIDDTSTHTLMNSFYSSWQEQGNAAVALASAQRKSIAGGTSPEHWASFVMLGTD